MLNTLNLLKFATPKPLLEVIKTAKELNRSEDKGLVNKQSGSAILTKSNGDAEIVASEYATYKVGSNGVTTEMSMQSNTITNTKNLKVDNLTINRHRLNPALWELTDFKKIRGQKQYAIGDLNMYGTVLVKAYEPTLQRHVLIRRPTRMPLFSTTLDIPSVPENLNLSASLEKDLMEYLID